MQLDAGAQRFARRVFPRWLLERIDPFQAGIDSLVTRASNETDPGMVVLDAGAGESRHAPWFAHARYIALDRCIGDPLWDYASVDVCADLLRLPFAAGSVDRVLCVVTLEHLADPAAAVIEFARVMKPGGRLYLVTPLMWEEHQAPYDYFRFTRWGLRDLLQRAGLEVSSIEPVGGFFWMIGRRCVHLASFFQSSWKWILFPLVGLIAGVLVPLLCYYLDSMDPTKAHTLGHVGVAVRRLSDPPLSDSL